MKNETDIIKLRADLLGWYDRMGRTLPWRVRPEDRKNGIKPDPYAVWLSEIMLQQTTIAHGTPYWFKFLEEFPTVTDLANAPRDRILALWSGLGYYARARNLHKCAGVIRDDYAGQFPTTEKELLNLPGIGPYTAATIAAICFNEATNIVDGNVERVISRLFRVDAPLPKGKKKIKAAAATLIRDDRPGDYGQALMDLGATVCMVKSPNCKICPWSWACQAHKDGVETDYPKRAPKKSLPKRYGVVFIMEYDGSVFMQTRPDEALLGGMLGFPGSDWGDRSDTPLNHAPIKADWVFAKDRVNHVFTHFELYLDVARVVIQDKPDVDGTWVDLNRLEDFALPTVMRKCLKA